MDVSIGTKRRVAANQQLDVWLLSKETFLQNASQEDRDYFEKCSPLDVQKEIARLQKDKSSSMGKYMRKLQPYLDGIQSLDAVISPLANLVPYGIGNFIWGSVKICFDLVSKYAKLFDTLETFMSSIGRQLERLETLAKLYTSITPTRFSNALAAVFTKYLAFYSYTRDYLSSSHTRKFRESVGLTRHPKCAMITLSIDQVREACANAVEEADLAEKQSRVQADREQSEVMSRIEEKLDFLGDQVRRSLQDNYLSWLQHVDMSKILSALLSVKKNNPEACSWIFEDAEFSKWLSVSRSTSKQRMFWLTGEPGVGKSIVSATIVDELKTRLEPNKAVAYFFCRHQDKNTRTVDAILRSWIWQLLVKPRGANEAFFQLPETEKDYTTSEEPNPRILCNVIRKLFTQNKEAILILDGLDECLEPIETASGSSSELRDWQAFFEVLRDMPDKWKLLIVSRPRTWYRPDIERNLTYALVEKLITEGENSDDISVFISAKLSDLAKNNRWSDQITQEANDFITSNAKGMFMWVNLMCFELQHLKGKYEDKIRAKLQNPPQGLDDFYDRSMTAIKNLHPDLAEEVTTALKWLLCAPRPLTFLELKQGLDLTLELEEKLPRFMGAFFKIDHTTGHIVLLHASGREYLLSEKAELVDNSSSSDQAKLTPIHAAMLKECLKHLSDQGEDFVEVDKDQSLSEERMRERLEDDPFLEYSAIYWLQHLVEAMKMPACMKEVEEDIEGFLNSDLSVVQWLQVFHFLFQFNYTGTSTTKDLVASVLNCNVPQHPWHKFIHDDHKSLVEHLGPGDGGRFIRWDRFMHVRHSFDHWGEPGRWYQSPTCFPGASIAAFFDYTDLLQSIVADKSEIDKRGPLNGTPLLWAATADSCKALRILLDLGADKEVGYENTGETPIMRSLRFPNGINERPSTYPTTLMLFEAGANLNPFPEIDGTGWIDRTVLITLIEERPDSGGAYDLARAILKKDPARERCYARRGTLLQTAAFHGKRRVLQALLEDEIVKKSINWGDLSMAPLFDGCTSNDPEIVKILLDAGAKPNLEARLNGWTALHFAVTSGGKAIATLLDAGADPAIPSESGDTAMHIAAGHDIPDIDFGLFLEHGHDIDLENENGETPLAIALSNWNFPNVSRLLDLGADASMVPPELLRQIPRTKIDPRLHDLHRNVWEACKSFEAFFFLRQCASQMKRDLPTPIIARILHYAGFREKLTAQREGWNTVNEQISRHGGDKFPYVKSPPIFGGASRPVCRIEMKIFGMDQGFGGEYDWSFYEVKTIDGRSKECVSWQPEKVWGHNGHEPTEKTLILDIEERNEQDCIYLNSLKTGDRVAIVQRAWHPNWANSTGWASIAVEIQILRDRWLRTERDEIWKHKKARRGRGCDIGRCPRCAVERIMQAKKKEC